VTFVDIIRMHDLQKTPLNCIVSVSSFGKIRGWGNYIPMQNEVVSEIGKRKIVCVEIFI